MKSSTIHPLPNRGRGLLVEKNKMNWFDKSQLVEAKKSKKKKKSKKPTQEKISPSGKLDTQLFPNKKPPYKIK